MTRIAFASVALLMIIMLDSASITHRVFIEYVLAGYLLSALVFMALTWANWWFDVVAARIEMVIDLVIGAMVVFASGGFNTSLFVLGNISIIFALIRWGWRESLITVALFLGIYGSVSLLSPPGESPGVDPVRLIARVGNALLLGVLALWVGSRRWGPPARALMLRVSNWSQDPAGRVIADVKAAVNASTAALIWSTDGVTVHIRRQGEATQTMDDERITKATTECEKSQLFSIKAARAAVRSDGLFGAGALRRTIDCKDALCAVGYDEGMAIPFCGDEASGIVVVSGIPGMCVDDLGVADEISSRACDAMCGAVASRNHARLLMTAANLETACNVHDTVIQSLSGTAFRLQALKTWIRSGRESQTEIDRLLVDIRAEQERVRDFVGQLRMSGRDDGDADIGEIVQKAAERSARTWSTICPVIRGAHPTLAPAWLGDEISMLVTEAISNAVRHGGATKIVTTISAADGWLSLSIEDNGRGFAADTDDRTPGAMPWSINQRIQKLGGHLTLQQGGQTRIVLTIPLGSRE